MPKVNEDLCAVFNQSDIKSHAKKKSMWGGSFKPGPHNDFVYNEESKSFNDKTITYADSLYKNFDEVLVNCVDIYVKNKTNAKKFQVEQCIIEFNINGYITIANTGQGMPVDIVRDIKGNPVYIPQLISTEFLAGSNNSDNEDRVTGGVNGIGLSMVFNNSTHTILETVDLERKKHYYQETHDRLKTIDRPVVSAMRTLPAEHALKKGGTSIKFKPAYDAYAFDMKSDYDDLNSLFKARAIQVAAHTGIEVTYNGVNVLPGKNKFQDFVSMFIREHICINIKHEKYPWDIAIGISNADRFQSVSVVNGVYVKTGNHINYIKDLVVDGLRTKAEKLVKKYREFKKSMLYNHMFVIMSGNIPSPDFDSQTKTNISGGTAKYKDYTIKPTDLNKIWKMIEPVLIAEYMENTMAKKKVKASTTGIKKYTAAKYVGKKPCKLLICEGDSAESMTHTALVSIDTDLNYDYCGTFNIGGVPINARTKSVAYKKRDGTIAYKREKMLVENERWSSLELVMNLNHDYTYESDAEFKTISYEEIIITVDQDLDGVGQICGLILSNIHLFWPALIRRGVIKLLETPIMRAYPKGRGVVVSFYTDGEYRTWVQKNFTGNDPDKYDIKYYKGLATHNDNEAIHMFKKYNEHLYTFTLDNKAEETFNIFYGKLPDLRKQELTKPLESKESLLSNDDKKNMTIPCSVHLKTHTKEFQLDNLMRKLPNAYDGLNPARRKSICGARKRFKNSNKELKIFQLAGYIAEHMNYQHGNDSLSSTLVNMAQTYVGANNYPLLLPLSQFGSRAKGGKDAGAPRYIKTKLNSDLVFALFREEDDYVIDYTTDEGTTNEPVNYMPVAPFAIMESLELPASGWKYCGYSRTWDGIYNNILQLFNYMREGNIYMSLMKPIPFKAMNWKGSVRTAVSKSGTKPWVVGSYVYDDKSNVIEITELPYQTWNKPFEESLKNKKHILSVDDKSSKLQINIKVKLRPGALVKIESESTSDSDQFDVIEEYLGLKSCMDQNLNMMKNGIVKEYPNYESVMYDWFIARYQTYKKRFERLVIIVKLRIIMIKEIIRFVEDRKKYNFSDIDEEKANIIMKRDKFICFNRGLLENPKFTPIDKLESLIMGEAPNASFDYLYSIPPKQQMQTARIARVKKLKELEDYYAHITGPDIIKLTWRDELDNLNSIIKKAETSERGWLYGESKAKLV